ncbi:MAG TPA: hypothetical protein DEB40_06140 [Elusimicrobia bacterium]|nr:hypothetical protein [Elusimicrobiota bacterium]HBT61307.1 hypothetical protein [Elusimicrobiota bacterium]
MMTAKRKTVLIVDDDPNFTRMLARLLKSRGFDATVASTMEAARRLIGHNSADAILLDVVLGSENGWDVLGALRRLCRTPVVMMTGGPVDEETRIDARMLGASDVLGKPFSPAELCGVLERVLAVKPDLPS